MGGARQPYFATKNNPIRTKAELAEFRATSDPQTISGRSTIVRSVTLALEEARKYVQVKDNFCYRVQVIVYTDGADRLFHSRFGMNSDTKKFLSDAPAKEQHSHVHEYKLLVDGNPSVGALGLIEEGLLRHSGTRGSQDNALFPITISVMKYDGEDPGVDYQIREKLLLMFDSDGDIGSIRQDL